MPQQPNQPRRVDSARLAAVLALCKMHGGMYANLAAESVPAGLATQQRAFAGALFYGTAERVTTLDALLAPLLSRPLKKLDAEVRAVLETGLYQLCWMETPPSAAVNEAVALTRALKKSSASGLVNAVLRKASGLATSVRGEATDTSATAYTAALLQAFDVKLKDDAVQRTSLLYSVSPGVAAAVMQALPKEYEAFLQTTLGGGNSGLRLTLRANTLKITEELQLALQQEGAKAEAAPLPGALYANLPGAVTGSNAFQQGLFHVQGLASQFACWCLGVQPGDAVLDLCAAPGGKSATLAQMAGGGAQLTSCDIHPHRVELIQNTLARLGITGATVVQNDAAVYNPALGTKPRVLCDVPCSGLGVLGKKPDLRLSSGEGFAALPELQYNILSTAARYVAPGGRLVYSTCTVLPAENGDIVEKFLQKHEDFRIAEAPVQAPKGATVGKNGITLLPQHTATDGFFVACMDRIW